MQIEPFDDHLAAPRGRGRLAGAKATGVAGGSPCGDLIRISLAVEGDRIAQAGFDAEGCAALIAGASAAVELLTGTQILDAAKLDADRVANTLGGLSPVRRHAAALVAEATHRALGAALAGGDIDLHARPNRTVVAISGGVDSAVAATLAREAGDEVVALTLELWSDPAGDGERSCCSPQAVIHARTLAQAMGLPHFTLDAREAFRSEVVDDFVAAYAAGETPNPCVRCNGSVRFDALLSATERLGAARLATGHYARIAHDDRGPLVRRARSEAKDQSYMLARLTPAALERLWFPLGDLEKPQVRQIARNLGLPVADRRESQDLCFLAGVGPRRFLDARLGERPGELVDTEGKTLGRHRGQHRFTVGQRRGIGVAAREPLYVLNKDARTGRVTVGPHAALARDRVTIAATTLHRPPTSVDSVKLRYRSRALKCSVEEAGGPDGRMTLALSEPAHGVAPGQSACLMHGDSVIGCGVIAADA